MRDVFRRFDKDRNGVITIEEMKEVRAKSALGGVEGGLGGVSGA